MKVVRNYQADYSLATLLEGYAELVMDTPISGLTLSSKQTRDGDVFFALPGTQYHGLEFAKQAINKGAVAVVYDPVDIASEALENIDTTITVAIAGLREKIGMIAARFYGYPARQLHVIGITGTNGKTSCSQFLGQVLNHCGIVGTLGMGVLDTANLASATLNQEPDTQLVATLNTTPDALVIQQFLAKMVEQKKSYVAIEVSSHGLVQGRINGLDFKGAVLTNISRDHLDYHGSMSAYVEAKTSLLKMPIQYAVINLDCDYYQQIAKEIPEQVAVWTISRSGKNLESATARTVFAEHIVNHKQGLQFDVVYGQQQVPVATSVYGEFNVENLLVVLAVLLANGCVLAEAIACLGAVQAISGRMENFNFGKGSPTVFIDYAHTSDALKQVLQSARPYGQEKLWLVFGCGGDRDQGKRALMGNIAERYADHIIITDDNPRNEEPAVIVNDILAGCNRPACNQKMGRKKAIAVIHDRQLAIETALEQAGPEDCVVIAGKGHEAYQEIAGQRHFFSDRKLLKEMILAQGARS